MNSGVEADEPATVSDTPSKISIKVPHPLFPALPYTNTMGVHRGTTLIDELHSSRQGRKKKSALPSAPDHGPLRTYFRHKSLSTDGKNTPENAFKGWRTDTPKLNPCRSHPEGCLQSSVSSPWPSSYPQSLVRPKSPPPPPASLLILNPFHSVCHPPDTSSITRSHPSVCRCFSPSRLRHRLWHHRIDDQRSKSKGWSGRPRTSEPTSPRDQRHRSRWPAGPRPRQ